MFADLVRQRQGPITIVPQDVTVQSFGDLAIITAHLTSLPTSPVRQRTVFPRRTFVLRRLEGRWSIVHLHASNFVVEPTPE